MSITQSGNLGIGTAAPGAKLDVIGQAAIGSGGSTQNYGYDLYVNGSNPTAFIDAYANPGTASLILQGRGASPSNQTLSVNNNGIFSVVPSSTGTAAMSITQSGNLGIGTAAPGAKLDVIGQAAIGSGGNTQTFGYDLYVNANNPSMLLDAYANPGTASLTLQGRGASASNQTLSVNSSGLLSIAPSGTGTAALSITQSGNVGIGTTPTSKLNVSTGNTAFTVDSVIGVVTTTTSVNALTGEATTANGVIGQTTDPSSIANGVWGTANGTGSVGVRAQNNSTGVASLSVANGGTAAQLSSLTNSGTLLLGNSGSVNCPTSGSGCTTVFSIDASGNATFHNVTVNGTLTKPMGSFRIDHPLDPENKYLYHSFVESPDMKNIYDGVAILDEHGEATISLPDWFEALNQDFRYQLTCIGGYAPVYVASEVSGNQFRVAGGRPGLKVSWQLTGIRHDAYANAHRIQVEVDKPAAERDHLTSSLSSVPAGNGQ
ncbi:MAG: hypothetical protein JOZ22_00315 [Acidobacteriia bacterium]|nr:hypothetical protein [Terriglobia bacterium]